MNKKQSKTCISLIKNKRGKLVMAGDRQVSCDWGFSYTAPFPKIKIKENGMLIGASGDSGLCKLLVDVLEPPVIQYDDLDNYMYYHLQPEVFKLLCQQKGYVNEHKQLSLPYDTYCMALIGIMGRAYTLEIINIEPVESRTGGSIIIDDAPIPYAIGCGAVSALPILMLEHKAFGYNTKDQLRMAMEMAADISPGCDDNIDYISE